MTKIELNNKNKISKHIGMVFLYVLLIMTTLLYTRCNDDDDKTIYKVTFETDGGSPVPEAQKVEEGKTATAPETNPTKTGYVFSYWHLSGSMTAYNFQTPVTGNITLYAKWQEEATAEYWQIIWNLNGGTWPSGDNHATQVLKGGTLAEPNVPTNAGHVFEGWYKESALINKITFPYDVSNLTSDFTLYAKWTVEGGAPEDITVYTAGYYMNSQNIKVACYWKNNTRYDLTDGTTDAEVNDITVVNNVVYTAGYYRSNDVRLIACYWIDSQKYDLTTASDEGEALAIEVYNGKVYTSGYHNIHQGANDGYKQACYWIDGQEHLLYSSKTVYRNIARDIAVIDGVVYTCGNYRFGSDNIACFWVGSTKYDLQSNMYDSYAYSMFYNGSQFSIAGSYGDGKPCCFDTKLDGSSSIFPLNPKQTGGYAHAIDVWDSGKTTYVIGYRGVSGNDEPVFWKNNNVEQAPDAGSIYLHNEIIYIAGSAGNSDNNAACYWKRNTNGTSFTKTILTEQGRANAIMVK